MTGQLIYRQSPAHTEPLSEHGREIFHTVATSTITGVAATILSATVFSPFGLAGFVGTSLASGLSAGANIATATDGPYANLPAFPAPFTDSELSEIRGELARTGAEIELAQAASEVRIARIQAVALTDGTAGFGAMPVEYPTARIGGGLRVAAIQPAALPQPGLASADYAGGEGVAGYHGSHGELADLMFAHENF